MIQYAVLSFTGGAYGPVRISSAYHPCTNNIHASHMLQLIGFCETFIAAMLAHPESQQKAHEEIDAVVGRSRMPSLADRESLPYVEALFTELLRWMPPVSFGALHLPYVTVASFVLTRCQPFEKSGRTTSIDQHHRASPGCLEIIPNQGEK